MGGGGGGWKRKSFVYLFAQRPFTICVIFWEIYPNFATLEPEKVGKIFNSTWYVQRLELRGKLSNLDSNWHRLKMSNLGSDFWTAIVTFKLKLCRSGKNFPFWTIIDPYSCRLKFAHLGKNIQNYAKNDPFKLKLSYFDFNCPIYTEILHGNCPIFTDILHWSYSI